MLRETKRKYTHVYMDLSEEIVYFHATSASCRLGESLIDFIYKDLNAATAQPDTLRDVHPYFSLWEDTQIAALFTDVAENPPYGLTLERIRELQQTYMQLLKALTQNAAEVNDEATHYFLRHPFYSSGTLVNQTVRNENRWMIDYLLMSFEDCLMCELMEMVRRHLTVKTCKNCGRFFLPKRSNVDYCSRIFSEDGRTCSEVGYMNTFAKSVQNDDLLQAYTRAYKAHYARMTKPRKRAANMTREEFEAWYREAKNGLELARQGKIEKEAYKEWLKQ